LLINIGLTFKLKGQWQDKQSRQTAESGIRLGEVEMESRGGEAEERIYEIRPKSLGKQ